MANSIFDYPNTIEDIIGYDPEVSLGGKPQSLLRALTNYKRVDKGAPQQPTASFLDPASEAKYKYSDDTTSPYQYLNRGVFDTHVSGTNPLFNVRQNPSPEPKQYGKSIFDYLPEGLAKEIQSYDARTLPDLFLKGLTSMSPMDLINMLNSTPSYKESEMLHSNKGKLKHLDQDPLAAPPVVSGITRPPSEPTYMSSEHLKNLMREYGIITEAEHPVGELVSSLVAPPLAFGAAKGAMKAVPSAMSNPNSGIVDFINSLMRRSPDQLNPIK